MDYFARAGALSGFPELVRELGGNPTQLLNEVGLGTSVLHDPDLYLPYLSLAQLYQLAAERCNTPDFGVRLGARQGLEVVGALGSCLCLQATVGDALRILQMNLDFHARGVNLGVAVTGETLNLTMQFAFTEQTDCTQLTALSVALLARGIQQFYQPAKPLDAELAIASPDDKTRYQQAFACPVYFDGATNRLSYPLNIVQMPVNVAQSLRDKLSAQWRGDWQQSKTAGVSVQVERAINALLPTGECKLELVAKLMDIQPRRLQQKLQAEGRGFSDLLQQTRLHLARQHLANSDIDLTTLAMNLGFAELAVFSRAFKKWTGMSPRAWRQQTQSHAG